MGQGFGRHPRGGMQIFVKTFKIRYTLQKMMILGGIPAKEDHKAPGKSLAGDDLRCPGKGLAGAVGAARARTLLGETTSPSCSLCFCLGVALVLSSAPTSHAQIRGTKERPYFSTPTSL